MFHDWIIFYCAEAYSEPCQTSKMKRFAKIVYGFSPLSSEKEPKITSKKSAILNIWQDFDYGSAVYLPFFEKFFSGKYNSAVWQTYRRLLF